jgi:CRP/FNR family transcriptional regulator, cyclic AMP receptor protein
MKSRHSPFTGNSSVLHTLQPFSWLSDEQLQSVLPSIQYRKYPAGVPILRAGDKADGLYILLSGRVLVVYEGHEGHELVLSAIGPHEFFGELGLFDTGTCAATVRSQQACETLFLPSELAIQCLQSSAR